MRLATFNVNGVNGRLPVLLRWLEEKQPEVACLQELKTSDEKFPEDAIAKAGYSAIWHGQKSYNGVAILAKGRKPVERRRGLPSPKFEYKLRWFERLRRYATDLAAAGQPVALCGDYNVVPTDIDAVVPKRWVFDAVFFPESRNEYRLMLAEGWTDALRKVHPQKGIYTYWNFAFRGGYDKSSGLRMDHLLLNAAAERMLRAGGVDVDVRGWEKPSDHAPAWIELVRS